MSGKNIQRVRPKENINNAFLKWNPWMIFIQSLTWPQSVSMLPLFSPAPWPCGSAPFCKQAFKKKKEKISGWVFFILYKVYTCRLSFKVDSGWESQVLTAVERTPSLFLFCLQSMNKSFAQNTLPFCQNWWLSAVI